MHCALVCPGLHPTSQSVSHPWPQERALPLRVCVAGIEVLSESATRGTELFQRWKFGTTRSKRVSSPTEPQPQRPRARHVDRVSPAWRPEARRGSEGPRGRQDFQRPAAMDQPRGGESKATQAKGNEKGSRTSAGSLRESGPVRREILTRADLVQRRRPSQTRHTHMTRQMTQRAQQWTARRSSGRPLQSGEMQRSKLRRRGEGRRGG